MTAGLLTPASRRRLLGSAALLGSTARRDASAESADHDGPLVTAAIDFCEAERRMLVLIDGPGRVADDDARDLLLAPLRASQGPHLDLLCCRRAWGLAGHQARAVAFALWDGCELAQRAEAQGFLADRLLAALVRDLVSVPG